MPALDDAAKAASSFMDALRTQPLALALILVNIGLLMYLFFHDAAERDTRAKYVNETQQIVAHCLSVDDFNKLSRELEHRQ